MKTETLEEQILKLKAGEEDFAVNWRDPEVELPKDSCEVIALSVYGIPTRLHYSMKYKAFNVYDSFNRDDMNECKMNVIAWAHIPEWWNHMQDEEEE